MKKLALEQSRVLALLCFFTYFNAKGQINLVPNPSFEQYLSPPDDGGQIDSTGNWHIVIGTPDLFTRNSHLYRPVPTPSLCGVSVPLNAEGYREPRTGDCYAGLVFGGVNTCPPQMLPQDPMSLMVYTEIMYTKLDSKLLKNHVYNFNLYYCISQVAMSVGNTMAAYFTGDTLKLNLHASNVFTSNWYHATWDTMQIQIKQDSSTFFSSDTSAWHSFGGCFKAGGTEQFLNIGNFKYRSQIKCRYVNYNFHVNQPCSIPATTHVNSSNYLYIDDVSLYDVGLYSGNARCINDTCLAFNSNTNIGLNTKDSASYTWYPPTGLSCTNCPNPIANPSVSTTYYVTKTLCSIISKDSVLITVKQNATAPKLQLSNSIACLWDTLRFNIINLPATAFNYTWQPYGQYLQSNNNIAKALISNNNFYYYQISNQNTTDNTYCPYTLKDSIFVTLPDTCKKPIFVLPQVLTPNGDGFNDQLEIQLPNTKNATLQVFNRWGNLVYGTSNSSPVLQNGYSVLILKWDGTCNSNSLVLGGSGGKLPAGTYFYIVESTDNKGNVNNYKQFAVIVR